MFLIVLIDEFNSKSKEKKCRDGIPVTKIMQYLPPAIQTIIERETPGWIILDSDEGDDISVIRATFQRLIEGDKPFIASIDHHAIVVIGKDKEDDRYVHVIDSDNHGTGVGKRQIKHILMKTTLRIAWLNFG